VELVEGKLFTELAKARGGWLWHSYRIDSITNVVLCYCLGDFVEKAKGMMVNIVGEVAPTSWCGSLI
jgi:hypothetical protein